MLDFVTINENVEFVFTEKKSKFIANLIKINSQVEAEDVIKNKDLTDMIDILRQMVKEGRA